MGMLNNNLLRDSAVSHMCNQEGLINKSLPCLLNLLSIRKPKYTISTETHAALRELKAKLYI